MSEIEKELEAIKARNARVELDKAWETSWTRRIFIALVTYIVAAILLALIGDAEPLFKALVPATAYMLSTFSLPFIKNWWIARK